MDGHRTQAITVGRVVELRPSNLSQPSRLLKSPAPPRISDVARTMQFGPTCRTLLLMAAGAAPILSIPIFVLGIAPLSSAARLVVVPLGLISLGLLMSDLPEGRWARDGLLAGLAAVFAYDAVRLPLIAIGVWGPDFIPMLGGWISGSGHPSVLIGYAWRFLGDGGGMGMFFFLAIWVVHFVRPAWVTSRPLLTGIGYGIFIWSGLLATLVIAPRGQELLFTLTPLSFLLSLIGHLIYGAVLGSALMAALKRNAQTVTSV